MLSIHSANRIDEWNGHDLIEFASAVRRLELADGETVTTSGASVIFADIIGAIAHDGPIVTAVAAIGLVVMVLALVGWNRRAVAVLAATVAGALFMVAMCALLDLKVNFLDFIALPITLGIGIDYAINVAHRYDHGSRARRRDDAAHERQRGVRVLADDDDRLRLAARQREPRDPRLRRRVAARRGDVRAHRARAGARVARRSAAARHACRSQSRGAAPPQQMKLSFPRSVRHVDLLDRRRLRAR